MPIWGPDPTPIDALRLQNISARSPSGRLFQQGLAARRSVHVGGRLYQGTHTVFTGYLIDARPAHTKSG
jgi:hypothetical protein